MSRGNEAWFLEGFSKGKFNPYARCKAHAPILRKVSSREVSESMPSDRSSFPLLHSIRFLRLDRVWMMKFWARFVGKDYGPPPTPDESHPSAICGCRVLETLYSASRRSRVFIATDDDQHYRVFSEEWDDSDWQDGGTAFWYPRRTGIITDSAERAKDCALEFLKAT